MKKIVYVMLCAFLWAGCKKEEIQSVEKLNSSQINKESIQKMVKITNTETSKLREKIAQLKATGTRFNVEQSNNFIRTSIEDYCNALIEAQPEFLEKENMAVNVDDDFDDEWDNNPDVVGGITTTVLPSVFINKLDNLAMELDAVLNDSIYDDVSNLDAGAAAMEGIIQNHINLLLEDNVLSEIDRQALHDALLTAKMMVSPSLEFLYALTTGAEEMGENMDNWRRRTFMGKLLRAVGRVAIAVAAVTIASAILVKAALIIKPGATIFAKKIKAAGGFNKAVWKGVKKKYTTLNPNTFVMETFTGGLTTIGSLSLGVGTGMIKAAMKWNDDMSLKYWYKEFDFKTKGKL